MASTAKVWVISRYGWEYDDSRYYRPESDTGHPVSAFTIPELAKKFCDEKNVAEIRDMGSRGIADYVESYNYNSEEDEYKTFLEEHFMSEDLEFTVSPFEISDELLVEVMEYFDLKFYEVIEVSLVA